MRLLVSTMLLAAAAAGCSRSEADAAPVPAKVDVTLPSEEAFFDGPQADTLNTNCTACHSAEMVLYQPSLSSTQWAAVVRKMREVYKAPIAEEDDADIVSALVALRRE